MLILQSISEELLTLLKHDTSQGNKNRCDPAHCRYWWSSTLSRSPRVLSLFYFMHYNGAKTNVGHGMLNIQCTRKLFVILSVIISSSLPCICCIRSIFYINFEWQVHCWGEIECPLLAHQVHSLLKGNVSCQFSAPDTLFGKVGQLHKERPGLLVYNFEQGVAAVRSKKFAYFEVRPWLGDRRVCCAL